MENYKYWRENGDIWFNEYATRRREQFYFIGQELLVHHVLTSNEINSVLDFGCGVGRHLRHLTQAKDIEVYGFDQSLTMLNGVRKWADPVWYASHVMHGDPAGVIPLGDKRVEASFTSEVLLHCLPEHIVKIIRELVRVSSRVIFHIEPHADYPLERGAHNGCWFHDLVAAYAKIGVRAERLGRPSLSQELTVAYLDPTIRCPASFVSLLAEIEQTLQPALERSRSPRSHVDLISSL